MCCLLLVLGLLGPRVALLFTWLFTDKVAIAFPGNFWWPLLGLLVLPWTTLMFVLSYAPLIGVSGLGWLLVGLGLVADIGTYASRSASRRYQAARAT